MAALFPANFSAWGHLTITTSGTITGPSIIGGCSFAGGIGPVTSKAL